MSGTRGFWTCQRMTNGQRCGAINVNRVTYCHACRKARRPRAKPKHMAALKVDYQTFVDLNGGEHCGICGAPPRSRRLHRDHDHRTGRPRGLLCFPCNSALRPYMTLMWMRKAVAYLERAQERVQ